MKTSIKQKLILPILIGLVVLTIYVIYFAPGRSLGSFNDYDPDSHAQKEILVKLVKEQGIQREENSSANIFYVQDKQGTQMKIQTELSLPIGFENADRITLTGHICGGSFELIGVEI